MASSKCVKEGETLHSRIRTVENCEEQPCQAQGERRKGEGAPESTGSAAACGDSSLSGYLHCILWGITLEQVDIPQGTTDCGESLQDQGKSVRGRKRLREVVRSEHRPYSPPCAAPGVECGAVEVEELGLKE